MADDRGRNWSDWLRDSRRRSERLRQPFFSRREWVLWLTAALLGALSIYSVKHEVPSGRVERPSVVVFDPSVPAPKADRLEVDPQEVAQVTRDCVQLPTVVLADEEPRPKAVPLPTAKPKPSKPKPHHHHHKHHHKGQTWTPPPDQSSK